MEIINLITPANLFDAYPNPPYKERLDEVNKAMKDYDKGLTSKALCKLGYRRMLTFAEAISRDWAIRYPSLTEEDIIKELNILEIKKGFGCKGIL